MSIRSSRSLNNNVESLHSAFSLQNHGSPVSNKKSRKIRKTLDLICFDSTLIENDTKEKKQLGNILKSIVSENQENTPPVIPHNQNKPRQSAVSEHFKTELLSCTKVDDKDKRKIVRAKRLLRDKNRTENSNRASFLKETVSNLNISRTSNKDLTLNLSKNCNENAKLDAKLYLTQKSSLEKSETLNISKKSNKHSTSRLCKNNTIDKLKELEKPELHLNILESKNSFISDETEYLINSDINMTPQIILSTSDNSEVENLFSKNSELIITDLPSPISPSQSNVETTNSSILSNHLKFNTSQEDLRPSTQGSVESTTRRRTYELEDSIIDLTLLKTVSEQDSSRINSLPSSEKISSGKSASLRLSKVTMRRRWEKINSPNVCDSPGWVSKIENLHKEEVFSEDELRKNETSMKDKNIETKIKTPFKEKSSFSKKKSSKGKVPNFAAIHKRALEKMESIDEYKKRKENRAFMLLSGQKPDFARKTAVKKESRKVLRFAAGTLNTEKSPTFIPLPTTPLPKHVFNDSLESTESPQKIKAPVPFQWNPSKIPKFDFYKNDQKIPPPKFNFSKDLPKPIFEHKLWTPKNKNSKENGIYKPFNFQNNGNLKVGIVQKINDIKSVATKSKPEKNVLETKRCAIKGVRSNRRFELLMKMRKGK